MLVDMLSRPGPGPGVLVAPSMYVMPRVQTDVAPCDAGHALKLT